MTPLGYASYEGHTDIVELLLEKGADVNALNQVICFLLHKCTCYVVVLVPFFGS